MPADLAALDELFKATTPGPYIADGAFVERAEHPFVVIADCHEYETYSVAPEPNAAFIAAVHNAWPEIRRRLAIGDAAREVLEADRDLDRLMESCGDWPPGLAQQRHDRLQAARAKLRALMETPDA